MDNAEWVKDRNEAFLSMDENKIKDYCRKYKIDIPKNETVFWMGVHKVICNLYLIEDDLVSLDKYQESYKWLAEHGAAPTIN